MYKNLKLLLLFTLNSISMMMMPQPQKYIEVSNEVSKMNICRIHWDEKKQILIFDQFPVHLNTEEGQLPYPMNIGFKIHGTEKSSNILQEYSKRLPKMLKINECDPELMFNTLCEMFVEISKIEFPQNEIYSGPILMKYIKKHFFIIIGISDKSFPLLKKIKETFIFEDTKKIDWTLPPEGKKNLNVLLHMGAYINILEKFKEYLSIVLETSFSKNFILDEDLNKKNIISNMQTECQFNMECVSKTFMNEENIPLLAFWSSVINLTPNARVFIHKQENVAKTTKSNYHTIYKVYQEKSNITKIFYDNPFLIQVLINSGMRDKYIEYTDVTTFSERNIYINCAKCPIETSWLFLVMLLNQCLERTKEGNIKNKYIYQHVVLDFNFPLAKGVMKEIVQRKPICGELLKIFYPDTALTEKSKTGFNNTTEIKDEKKWFFKTTIIKNTNEALQQDEITDAFAGLMIDPYFTCLFIEMGDETLLPIIKNNIHKLLYMNTVIFHFHNETDINDKTLIKINIDILKLILENGDKVEYMKMIFDGQPHLQNINDELSKRNTQFTKIICGKKEKNQFALQKLDIILNTIENPSEMLSQLDGLKNNVFIPITTPVSNNKSKPIHITINIPEKDINPNMKHNILTKFKAPQDANHMPYYTLEIKSI